MHMYMHNTIMKFIFLRNCMPPGPDRARGACAAKLCGLVIEPSGAVRSFNNLLRYCSIE